MTSTELQQFLSEEGNSFTVESTEGGTFIHFIDRGFRVFADLYDDDPGFLLLRARCGFSGTGMVRDSFRVVLAEVERDRKVIKLSDVSSDSTNLAFEIRAEQFHADAASAQAVFWRLVDAMREAMQECYRRLSPSDSMLGAPRANEREAWLERIENALRSGCDAAESPPEGVGDKLRHALALVVDGNGLSGSAFCVASDSERSFYVTNAHVVDTEKELTLYRQYPIYSKMVGTVVAKGNADDVDLAILSVNVPSIQPVAISAIRPHRDMQITILGYPQVQFWMAERFGELQSAAHSGTITSVIHDGSRILNDAVSRPGNSGGPLFNSRTGEVLGVCTSGWADEEASVAIGRDMLLTFLHENAIRVNIGDIGEAAEDQLQPQG
jgi:S1-C subfamily serine protease